MQLDIIEYFLAPTYWLPPLDESCQHEWYFQMLIWWIIGFWSSTKICWNYFGPLHFNITLQSISNIHHHRSSFSYNQSTSQKSNTFLLPITIHGKNLEFEALVSIWLGINSFQFFRDFWKFIQFKPNFGSSLQKVGHKVYSW